MAAVVIKDLTGPSWPVVWSAVKFLMPQRGKSVSGSLMWLAVKCIGRCM